MKAKHNKVLHSIFETPVNASIIWKDIESLLVGLGADLSEGRGSRVRVALNGVRAVFSSTTSKEGSGQRCRGFCKATIKRSRSGAMLNYKGYIGHVEFDDENEMFVGEVINTKDVITFQSDTAHGLKQEFIESIDDYIAFCHERNEAPEKPFSGKFNLRITPELHREAYVAAKHSGMSLNSWVCDVLRHAV